MVVSLNDLLLSPESLVSGVTLLSLLKNFQLLELDSRLFSCHHSHIFVDRLT